MCAAAFSSSSSEGKTAPATACGDGARRSMMVFLIVLVIAKISLSSDLFVLSKGCDGEYDMILMVLVENMT